MDWRLAKSLHTLREQVNALYPTRSKDSDGSIGDANHSARTSDHNPNDAGIVCAIDITHDPQSGCDSYKLAEIFRANKDPRIKYVISNHKIFSSTQSAWQWRPYTGSNPHDHHVHISVKDTPGLVDDTKPWKLDGAPAPVAVSFERPPLTLRKGASGAEVSVLQGLLLPNGIFDTATEAAVKDFQKTHNLTPDGVVGPQTWKTLKLVRGN